MAKTQESLYRESLKQNEKRTYEDYISKEGIRTKESYYDSLLSAKTEKSLNNTNYGSRASNLYSAGLSASGYEDYLKNNIESQYKTNLNKSDRELLIGEYRNKSGYENYLTQYKALQEKISQSVISEFAKGNDFNYENAYAAAVKAGVSKALASFTASSAVRAAINASIEQAVIFAKANNLSAKKAKEYAKSLGLEEMYAEKVYDSISTFTKEEKDFYSSMSAENYYDYIMSKSKYK